MQLHGRLQKTPLGSCGGNIEKRFSLPFLGDTPVPLLVADVEGFRASSER